MAISTIEGRTRASRAEYPILTREEYEKIQSIFTEQLDMLIESYVDTETQPEKSKISEFIADILANFRIYRLFNDQSIYAYNSDIFRDSTIREFVLELLSRFSINIASIGNDAFVRTVNTLANGASVYGDYFSDEHLELMPILESIRTGMQQARTFYLENPWHVICTMLVMEFKRSELGRKFQPN